MDDGSNLLVNAALVAALVPVLTALGQVLKGLPPIRRVPQWCPLINMLLGMAIALGYTVARAQSGGVPATSVELTLAALAGVMAGAASAHVYDVSFTGLSAAEGRADANRTLRNPPES